MPNVGDILREVYALLDKQVDAAIANADRPVTCGTCREAFCCSQLTTISIPEGLTIAAELLTRPDWRSLLPALARAARADAAPGVNRATRFKARVPCGLLDPETKLCRAYDVRPGCCRFHTAVTPSRNCSPDAPVSPVHVEGAEPWSRKIGTLNLLELEGTLWKICAEISKEMGRDVVEQAPISLMVLLCLDALAGPDGDLNGALHGLPLEPLTWMMEHVEDLAAESDRDAADDPEERDIQEKLYTIGRKAFG